MPRAPSPPSEPAELCLLETPDTQPEWGAVDEPRGPKREPDAEPASEPQDDPWAHQRETGRELKEGNVALRGGAVEERQEQKAAVREVVDEPQDPKAASPGGPMDECLQKMATMHRMMDETQVKRVLVELFLQQSTRLDSVVREAVAGFSRHLADQVMGGDLDEQGTMDSATQTHDVKEEEPGTNSRRCLDKRQRSPSPRRLSDRAFCLHPAAFGERASGVSVESDNITVCSSARAEGLPDEDLMQFAKDTASMPHARRRPSILEASADESEELCLFRLAYRLREASHNIVEVDGNRPVDRLVRNQFFDLLCVSIICANMIFVALQTNYEIKHHMTNDADWIVVVEFFFSGFYVVELALRFTSSGKFFFVGRNWRWNLFDSFLLSLTLFSQIAGQAMRNWTFLRTLRILRVAKVIKMVRLVQVLGLEELAMMLSCVMGSISNLFWCGCLLSFSCLVFGIYFVQVLAGVLEFHPEDVRAEDMHDIQSYFGSVQSAMLTLAMATTGGVDWSDVFWLLEAGGKLSQMLFLFFVLFNAVSLWNVITSLFVEKALKVAKPTDERLIFNARQEEMKSYQHLQKLFEKADIDSSGSISWDEFLRFCKNPEFVTFLRTHGVDIKEAKTFFMMLVGSREEELQTKEVDINTLVSCCLRIKGVATSIDLHTVRYELKMMQRNQQALLNKVHKVAHKLGIRNHNMRSSALAPQRTPASLAAGGVSVTPSCSYADTP